MVERITNGAPMHASSFSEGVQIVAVEIGSNGKLEIGRPRLLFSRSFPGQDNLCGCSLYEVAPDGQRFVTFEEEHSDPEPTYWNLI